MNSNSSTGTVATGGGPDARAQKGCSLPGGATRPSVRPGPAASARRLIGSSSAIFAALVFFLATTAPSVSAVPMMVTSSVNWSGYGLAGSGFTGVTGTFNVPAPLQSASGLEETAVWVGVDGLDNHDLFQAGIAETNFAPTMTDTLLPYTPSSGFPGLMRLARPQVYAWWEDLPSAPVRVDLPVMVGDYVSVSIFKMSPGWWALAVHDLTDNQSFLLAQPYAGPQTSVEWVVEAPQISGTARIDPVPFSTVDFRDLGAQGEVHDLERFSLGSASTFSSRPDTVASTEQLMHSGFGVHLTVGRD